MSQEYVIGVDVGGTCTDCVILDGHGHITIAKTFSTPPDFSVGVVDVLGLASRDMDLELSELLDHTRLFLHATTIAENAIIDGDLAPAGLITTRGFEHTLWLMRGGYAEWSGRSDEEIKNVPFVAKPSPLLPVSMIHGIKERVDCWGEVVAAADGSEIAAAARSLVAAGAEALGVSFLWAFVNPAHEDLAGSVIEELYPQMFFTLSHEIAPTLGEFERTQTVALNIRLGPAVSSYLGRLKDSLVQHGYGGPLLVMQAYGGLLSSEEAARRPVGMIESGPVSGLVGSKELGRVLGYSDILGLDMGGTTFKAGVISEGSIDYAREPMVAGYHYASAKMNIESIGLAGGSIIALDPETLAPRIGPKSAGAYPGPVCYDHGGDEVTITDVDLILGYLDERYFLGGRERLNKQRASAVFQERIAEPLGMDQVSAAGEVFRLANSMIFDMMHKLTVERGLDPRTYTVFSSGGTAGMHVTSFVPELNVERIVIPYSASGHGALGLVTSDVVYEEQVSRPIRVPTDAALVNDLLQELVDKIHAKLRADRFGEAEIRITRSVDMRYRRQVHTVTTPIQTSNALTDRDINDLVDAFDLLYEQRFGQGSGYKEAGIEMVNFRVRGVGVLRRPALTGLDEEGPDPERAFVETRAVYLGTTRDVREVACYDFDKLAPGNRIDGPAIIWTPITTIVVNSQQTATCDPYKNVEITWERV